MEKALSTGPYGHVFKPIDISELKMPLNWCYTNIGW
jgi:hypothetical protein